MAVITQPLTEAQILGLTGTIDFYYFRGKTVARVWPKRRTIPATEKEIKNQTFFGRVQTKIKNMSEPNREEWRKFVQGRNIVWTDAVRFSNLENNPYNALYPSPYFTGIKFYRSAQHKMWWVRVDFGADDWRKGSGLVLGYKVSDAPLDPIKWQEVGLKRRRRAIEDKLIRPQYTGFDTGPMLRDNDFRKTYYSQLEFWKPFEYFRFAVVPYGMDTKRLQTPIYQFKAEWIDL